MSRQYNPTTGGIMPLHWQELTQAVRDQMCKIISGWKKQPWYVKHEQTEYGFMLWANDPVAPEAGPSVMNYNPELNRVELHRDHVCVNYWGACSFKVGDKVQLTPQAMRAYDRILDGLMIAEIFPISGKWPHYKVFDEEGRIVDQVFFDTDLQKD